MLGTRGWRSRIYVSVVSIKFYMFSTFWMIFVLTFQHSNVRFVKNITNDDLTIIKPKAAREKVAVRPVFRGRMPVLEYIMFPTHPQVSRQVVFHHMKDPETKVSLSTSPHLSPIPISPSPSPGKPFSMQSIISCPLCTLQAPLKRPTVHLNVMIPGSTVCVCVCERVNVCVCTYV